MISFLKGKVASKSVDNAVVEVGGVGYLLFMSMDAISKLPSVGKDALVHCRMVVSDAGVVLYGFSDENERQLFDLLITVSGIGPKTALASLSCYSASALIAAIVSQDIKAISKIPGIGKKSASRIVLELKDKFPDVVDASEENLFNQEPSAISDVCEALQSMGFTKEEIERSLKNADRSLSEAALLQYALKQLG